jgi:hypothetical protein
MIIGLGKTPNSGTPEGLRFGHLMIGWLACLVKGMIKGSMLA